MKIFFLNDTTEWYHWGCTGTSSMLTERMRKYNHIVDAYSAKETYSRPWPGRPDVIGGFQEKEIFMQFCRQNAELIEHINAADAVVINGEGTIHGLHYPPLNLLYIAYIGKVFLNKHVEIINHSVYPEDGAAVANQRARLLYQLVYKQLDYVAVREPLSLAILQEMEIDATQSFDCLPLYIKEHYTSKKHTHKKRLIFAGTAAWTEFSPDVMAKYLKWVSQLGYHITILTGSNEQHRGESQVMSFPDDSKVVEFFEDYLPDISWEVIEAGTMTEWLDAINNAEILVSGRFHHTIAAVCLDTPFVVLNSNTPKIDGCMQVVNMLPALQYQDDDLLTKLIKRTEEALLNPTHADHGALMRTIHLMAENNFSNFTRWR